MPNAAVPRDISRFISLRLSRESFLKLLAPHLPIFVMDALEKIAANYFLLIVTSQIQHCLIAPLVIAINIQRIDGFASALQNILQQRLPLSGDSFRFAQLRQVA